MTLTKIWGPDVLRHFTSPTRRRADGTLRPLLFRPPLVHAYSTATADAEPLEMFWTEGMNPTSCVFNCLRCKLAAHHRPEKVQQVVDACRRVGRQSFDVSYLT